MVYKIIPMKRIFQHEFLNSDTNFPTFHAVNELLPFSLKIKKNLNAKCKFHVFLIQNNQKSNDT